MDAAFWAVIGQIKKAWHRGEALRVIDRIYSIVAMGQHGKDNDVVMSH